MSGASAIADRAGGPADLSRCASQPKALIPSVIGNIYSMSRPDMPAIEARLSAKYLTLLTRVYRYRRAGNFTLSCAAGKAADVVLARIANLETQRIAA